jgi:hypothetical protein
VTPQPLQSFQSDSANIVSRLRRNSEIPKRIPLVSIEQSKTPTFRNYQPPSAEPEPPVSQPIKDLVDYTDLSSPPYQLDKVFTDGDTFSRQDMRHIVRHLT